MNRPNLDHYIAGWRGPVLAALLALIAGLPSLMLLPPLDRDESRFAQATASAYSVKSWRRAPHQAVRRAGQSASGSARSTSTTRKCST